MPTAVCSACHTGDKSFSINVFFFLTPVDFSWEPPLGCSRRIHFLAAGMRRIYNSCAEDRRGCSGMNRGDLLPSSSLLRYSLRTEPALPLLIKPKKNRGQLGLPQRAE